MRKLISLGFIALLIGSFLFPTTYVFAAAAPTVTTIGVTGIGSTWAIISMEIAAADPDVTAVGADYGLTGGYGSEVTRAESISDFPADDTILITGLNPGTLYYYRPKAENSEGWGVGSGSTFTTTGVDTKYEYFSTGDDTYVSIYGANTFGQTFTTSVTAHTASKIRLRLYRVGDPGTATVSIYRTTSSLPTGSPIITGTINGSTLTTDTAGGFYFITLSEEVPLNTETMYAAVISAVDGDSSNKVCARVDTGNGYSGGTQVSSTDGGNTWSATAANDLMFEVWGGPSLAIEDAKVFTSYIDDDDELFAVSYKVLVGDEYVSKDPKQYFTIQIWLGSSMKAQTSLPAWGYKPASIYINADEALTLGQPYTIRLAGLAGTAFEDVVSDYILLDTDWSGEDLNQLDSWVISLAHSMEDFYDVTLTQASVGMIKLNDSGSAAFLIGMPFLSHVRPDLFSDMYIRDLPAKTTHDTSYQDTLAGGFGEHADEVFDSYEDLTGADGDFMKGAMWLWVCTAAAGVIGVANPVIGLMGGFVFVIIGIFIGAFTMQYVLLIVFIVATWLVIKVLGPTLI